MTPEEHAAYRRVLERLYWRLVEFEQRDQKTNDRRL
jgi:hypothetical protein